MTTIRMTGLDREPVQVEARALKALSARLDGPLLRPGDDGFGESHPQGMAASTKVRRRGPLPSPSRVPEVPPQSRTTTVDATRTTRSQGMIGWPCTFAWLGPPLPWVPTP